MFTFSETEYDKREIKIYPGHYLLFLSLSPVTAEESKLPSVPQDSVAQSHQLSLSVFTTEVNVTEVNLTGCHQLGNPFIFTHYFTCPLGNTSPSSVSTYHIRVNK